MVEIVCHSIIVNVRKLIVDHNVNTISNHVRQNGFNLMVHTIAVQIAMKFNVYSRVHMVLILNFNRLIRMYVLMPLVFFNRLSFQSVNFVSVKTHHQPQIVKIASFPYSRRNGSNSNW